jgi:N-acetylglucosaminyl-diphospho-decaprenol L-rhamnosyltransferase
MVLSELPSHNAVADKDISVIIVNYNARDYLRMCLDTLIENPAWPERLEVIVVDNASRDNSREMVRNHFGGFHFIANDSNIGFAAANNQGIRQSHGRYIVLLNPDTRVPSDALLQLVNFMDAHPDAAVCGPQLLNPDGSIQLSCRRFPTLTAVLIRGTFLNRFLGQSRTMREYLMLDWDHQDTRTVDWVLGACFVMRREAIEKVGLLDDGFFVYYEDIDWCYRAWRLGWRVYYYPIVSVWHYYQRASSKGIFSRVSLYHLESIFRLFRKHGVRLNVTTSVQRYT